MVPPMIMVVSHSVEVQQAIASALGPSGLAPIVAFDVQEAIEILSRHPICLVFCSDELPDEGLEVLMQHASRPSCRVPVVVISRDDNWERYLENLRHGAFDYVLYPLSRGEIERHVTNVQSHQITSIDRATTRTTARTERKQVLLRPHFG